MSAKVEIPTFSGDIGENPKDFFDDFKTYVGLIGRPRADRVSLLSLALRGPAKEMYRAMRGRSYNDIRAAITAEYRGNEEKLRADIDTLSGYSRHLEKKYSDLKAKHKKALLLVHTLSSREASKNRVYDVIEGCWKDVGGSVGLYDTNGTPMHQQRSQQRRNNFSDDDDKRMIVKTPRRDTFYIRQERGKQKQAADIINFLRVRNENPYHKYRKTLYNSPFELV